MKKGKSKSKHGAIYRKNASMSNKEPAKEETDQKEVVDIDDEEKGFGTWLKSGDGIEWMRLFVIGNSICVFITMAWPSLQRTFEVMMEMIYGEEEY